MIRHFFYLVLLVMFLNIILNVPSILLQNRFQGSIMSMIIGIPLSTGLSYFFIKGISKFKQQSLSDIFLEMLPKFVAVPYLIFLGLMWTSAGGFALISYSYIIKLYLNPEMSMRAILGFLLTITIYGAIRKSRSILYLIEIVTLAAFPLVFYILFKTFTEENFYPIHMLRIIHFTWQMPNYSSLSAATYIFIGYINLAVFNRQIYTQKTLKFFWTIPLVGIGMLASSFFIPIGFFGINGIKDIVFPWLMVADTLRMQYGFIERTIYVLLVLYLMLTLIFAILTWHIGLKLISGAILNKNKKI